MGMIMASSFGEWPARDETHERVGKWILENASMKTGSRHFLRPKSHSEKDLAMHRLRTVEFAEAMFNLQLVPGIFELYQKIFSQPDSMEAHYLELEALKILLEAHLQFRINKPKDFQPNHDCEIIISPDLMAPCEVKCRLETSEFSSHAVSNPLKKAKNQLPKDGCGVVILKVPEAWNIGQVQDCVRNELRKTTRISEVIVYTRRFQAVTEIVSMYHPICIEILNRNSPFAPRIEPGILSSSLKANGMRSANWFTFSLQTEEKIRKLLASA